MSEQPLQSQQYMVSIYESERTGDTLIFTFVPKAARQERGPGGVPKRVPQFIVTVRPEASGLVFDWSATPDDPGSGREEIEAEVAARMKDRAAWIERVESLVGNVEQWAKELGWSTRRIEKKLEDTRIGQHQVPALLMQEGTRRALL